MDKVGNSYLNKINQTGIYSLNSLNESTTPVLSKNKALKMKNYSCYITKLNNLSKTPTRKANDKSIFISKNTETNVSNTIDNKNYKSHSSISNYKNNATSIKDLKLNTQNQNVSVHKSLSNINCLMGSLIKSDIKLIKEKRVFNFDAKAITGNKIQKGVSKPEIATTEKSKNISISTYLDQKNFESSSEFEKYKSNLLEKLHLNINLKRKESRNSQIIENFNTVNNPSSMSKLNIFNSNVENNKKNETNG